MLIVLQFISLVPDPLKYSLGTLMTGMMLLMLERRARTPELRDGVITQGFEHAWVLWLGQVSYSVYLYQQIFHAMKADLSVIYAPLFLLPSLAVGYVSWRYVEQPARRTLNNLQDALFLARST